MIKILYATCVFGLLACNNSGKVQGTDSSKAPNSDSTTMHIQIPKQGCYVNVAGRDSVRLKIEIFPSVVIGTLHYNHYEKDKNAGEFEGVFRGDTLVADYSFMSEGVRSIRQVVFLVKDSAATEGYGDMEERDGKMVFKNIGTIDFAKGMRLQQVSCIEDAPATASVPQASLNGGSELLYAYKWKLAKLNGKVIEGLPEQRIPELGFTAGQENRVAGTTGCNRLTGSFDLPARNKIKFAPMATTKMACVDDNIEYEFLTAIGKIDGYEVGEGVLRLKAGKNIILEFAGK